MIQPVANLVHDKRAGNLRNKPDMCLKKEINHISFTGVSIIRFSKVDETLYRGGRPEPEQMQELKNIGIGTIIDLSVEKQRLDGYSEEVLSKNLGMNYVNIPLVTGDNPSETDIDKFFETIRKVKEYGDKAFIHCFEGKERTGLMVELYKIRYGLSNAEGSINNLIKGRYNFSENPLALGLIKNFAENVKNYC